MERGAGVGVRNAEGWTAGEYAYSGKVGVGMQAIAREVLETRRRRREGRESGSGKRREDGGRLRSGSVSTDASLGSGSASAHPNPSIQFPFPEVGAGARSAPSSRRPSGGHVSPPPLPTWTYTSPSIRPARFTHSSSSSSPSASQRSASSQNLPPIVTTYTSPPTRPAQLAHSSSSSSSPSVSQPQQPPSPYPPPQLPQTGIKFGTRTQSPQPYHSPSLHSDSSSNLRRPEMSSRNSPRSNGMGLETAPGPPTLVAGQPSFPPGPPTIAPGPPTLGAYLPTTRTLSPIITSTPPLPAPPAGGPISMRRANSAQTTSSAGSGVGMDRVPSGTSGRGTPI